MLAMQYSVKLPTEYTLDRINERVAQREPKFEGRLGLKHKFYLYEREEHIYAPLYIWQNTQAAQDFLMDSLFGDVVQDFGRPRVRSWQILEFDYGPSQVSPISMTSEVDKVCARKSLGALKDQETANHQQAITKEGLFAHLVLLDPDRWEISRCSLWSVSNTELKSSSDCIYEYDVIGGKMPMSGAA